MTNADFASEFLTLHEVIEAAHRNLDPANWDYLTGGSGAEVTLARNRQALDSVAFRPRVLRDVAEVDTSGEAFGHRLSLPVVLAPVASLASFSAAGLVEAARASRAFGAALMCGSLAAPELLAAAAAVSGAKIFQFYVTGDDAHLDAEARRAAASGYDAFCLAVDGFHPGRRDRDTLRRSARPLPASRTEDSRQASLTWDDVKRFKDRDRLPLVLKGITTGEDAAIAAEHGVDVVYISNQGGRQLDHGVGALEVLPEVVSAVDGRCKVWIDGGICRGDDVVKAMALGADLVGIGRLYCYGLAAAGEVGAKRVLDLLRSEVAVCLGQLGVTSFSQLDASYLRAAVPTRPPGVLSAFPLLDVKAQARPIPVLGDTVRRLRR
jgi:isopentenyl diphosphate isomerase/L-lactate dehydrogenase-like FMN-dependent dehydrogenase